MPFTLGSDRGKFQGYIDRYSKVPFKADTKDQVQRKQGVTKVSATLEVHLALAAHRIQMRPAKSGTRYRRP